MSKKNKTPRCIKRVPVSCFNDTGRCPFPMVPGSVFCSKHQPETRRATIGREIRRHEDEIKRLLNESALLPCFRCGGPEKGRICQNYGCESNQGRS